MLWIWSNPKTTPNSHKPPTKHSLTASGSGGTPITTISCICKYTMHAHSDTYTMRYASCAHFSSDRGFRCYIVYFHGVSSVKNDRCGMAYRFGQQHRIAQSFSIALIRLGVRMRGAGWRAVAVQCMGTLCVVLWTNFARIADKVIVVYVVLLSRRYVCCCAHMPKRRRENNRVWHMWNMEYVEYKEGVVWGERTNGQWCMFKIQKQTCFGWIAAVTSALVYGGKKQFG